MGPSPVTLDTSIINEELVGSLSRILTENGIPCVLWGNYLLTVYGVPSMVDVSFRLSSMMQLHS